MILIRDNFCIIRAYDVYKIQIHDTGETRDKDISKYLDLTIEEYRRILVENYNGVKQNLDKLEVSIVFSTKEDIQAAITWANSIVMMNKLRKKVKNV